MKIALGLGIVVIAILSFYCIRLQELNFKLNNQNEKLVSELKVYNDTYKYAYSYLGASVNPIMEKDTYKIGDPIEARIILGSHYMIYKDQKVVQPYVIYGIDIDTIANDGKKYDTARYKDLNSAEINLNIKNEISGYHVLKGAVVIPKPWKKGENQYFHFSRKFKVTK